jgi:hypothetical protein
MVTKQKFGQELKNRLIKKQSMQKLAVWLHSVYLSIEAKEDSSFNDVVYALMMMDAGPEFEYSYEELNFIVDKLIAGDDVKLHS